MTGGIAEYIAKTKTVIDMTVDGKCCGCGECCGSMLPITQTEEDRIIQYMRKHNIKPHAKVSILSVPSIDLTCPFLDTTKTSDRCMIYSVRPMICRNFICNKPERLRIKGFINNVLKMKRVNMWDVAERGMKNE